MTMIVSKDRQKQCGMQIILFNDDNNVLLENFVRMVFLRVNLINGNTKMEYGNMLCIKISQTNF